MQPYGVDIFTGVRPTGVLSVANYVGAVRPLLELQTEGRSTAVFVADLHAFTDHDPRKVEPQVKGIVADYIALGLDPHDVKIFVQSDITDLLSELTLYLMRHVTVAELLRVPTLKEKLRKGKDEVTANALLATYPVLMAADILMQRARTVPVGEDQVPHIEITRRLAKRFNKAFGSVLPLPRAQEVEPVRILSLDGNGKMSKSSPRGLISLTEDPASTAKKIKYAQTAIAGEMPPVLQSHFTLAEGLTRDPSSREHLEDLKRRHMEGHNVMVQFKGVMTDLVIQFLAEFQRNRADILENQKFLDDILSEGASFARENGEQTMRDIRLAMGRV